jgi:hypothetical protein
MIMNPGEAPGPGEATPDAFERAPRTWVAHDGIIAESYTISDLLDLDPALVDQMQTACRGDDAVVAMRGAACDLLEAVNEELDVRSS